MKITILDGNPSSDNSTFDNFIWELENQCGVQGIDVTRFMLRDMEIKYCTGCWGCWVKTPGECLFTDDSSKICREVIVSDLLLFASPIIMGFTSALLKKAMDKLIPLVHPYIEISHNECHHRSRYDQYPRLGLILEKSPGTDQEDIDIITQIYQRLALNLKSELCFVYLSNNPIEEVLSEINRI